MKKKNNKLIKEHEIIYMRISFKEWEAFTGMIVADVKTDAARGLPSWIEPERAQAVANLKVSMQSFTVETSLLTLHPIRQFWGSSISAANKDMMSKI